LLFIVSVHYKCGCKDSVISAEHQKKNPKIIYYSIYSMNKYPKLTTIIKSKAPADISIAKDATTLNSVLR
jgi:hypothetical protein